MNFKNKDNIMYHIILLYTVRVKEKEGMILKRSKEGVHIRIWREKE